MNRLITSLVALLLSLVVSGALAQAPKSKKPAGNERAYGTLAVDKSKGFIYAFSHDHKSREAANQRANRECAKLGGKCDIVVEFSGEGCAGYTTIDARRGSAYGWATDADRATAQRRSLEYCQQFSNGTPCTNNVWACNAKGSGVFKADRVEPIRIAGECYAQFEVQLDDTSDDWVGRFYTPVYHLKAEDCPVSGKHGYFVYYDDLPAYKAEDNLKADASGRGHRLAQDFHAWLKTKQSPYRGTVLRSVGSLAADRVAPEALSNMVKNNSELDAGISPRKLPGATITCFDYTIPGVTPIAVLGAERCQRWVK